MKASKLSDANLKTIVLRVYQELSENISCIIKAMENTKKNQSKVKNTLTEIKDKLQVTNNRVDKAEGWVSYLEDKKAENNQ